MKVLLAGLLLATALNADTYDYDFSVSEDVNSSAIKSDPIMNGNFLEIIRFDQVDFGDVDSDEASNAQIDEMADKIKEYQDGSKEIIVTNIGHTDYRTDHENEEKVDSDTYANAIQNFFRDSLGAYCSADLSGEYADDVRKRLVDKGVDENATLVEYRSDKDLAFSDATEEGEELSNRVMVAMYVLVPKDVDSDKDGVMDSVDRCLGTIEGLKVNKYGCPIDSDADGVLDNLDRCAQTPPGVNVDKHGCPLDSDGDGILDYKDRCANTILKAEIDEFGCPITRVLSVNFESKSSKILKSYHSEILEFAEFLRKYPKYSVQIIGHTDSVGEEARNMKLSQTRAASVKTALEEEGISAVRLISAGRGELDPIQTNRTAKGRRANRRIEAVLTY